VNIEHNMRRHTATLAWGWYTLEIISTSFETKRDLFLLIYKTLTKNLSRFRFVGHPVNLEVKPEEEMFLARKVVRIKFRRTPLLGREHLRREVSLHF